MWPVAVQQGSTDAASARTVAGAAERRRFNKYTGAAWPRLFVCLFVTLDIDPSGYRPVPATLRASCGAFAVRVIHRCGLACVVVCCVARGGARGAAGKHGCRLGADGGRR